jgi:pimeloyl-ACP methyl ester carboxylesterase
MLHSITHEVESFDPAVNLRAPPTPILVMVGGKDTSADFRAARQLAALMPAATGCVAPKVGHTWNIENPGLFNRTVRAWISGSALPKELLPLN